MNLLRGGSIAGLFIAASAAALRWLPPWAALGSGALLALCAVVLLRRPILRNAALVGMSVLLGLAGADLAFGLIDPRPNNDGVIATSSPSHWTDSDPILGYRLQAGLTIKAAARYGTQALFDTSYALGASGERLTPGSVAEGPTYLFIGGSLVFGSGLGDRDTLPSQFAQQLPVPAHVVNLGVPGYGPGHMVRALEEGLYDRHVVGKVAAVITLISTSQMKTVTGDGGWLALSPRYELDDAGRLRHTGTFLAHWLGDPLAGAGYLARSQLPWVERGVGEALRHERRALTIALTARLQELVRQRYDAPLVLVYQWPDSGDPNQYDGDEIPTMRKILALGMPAISVHALIRAAKRGWDDFFIPHDGHPNAKLTHMVAASLQSIVPPTVGR